MKTKEDVIKEAYGEYWNQVKEHVDDNGWCSKYIGLKILDNITCDFKEMHIIYGNPENWIRPISLQEIETNNGWIKVETEEDLPLSGDLYLCKLSFSAWDDEDYIYYLMKDFHKSVPSKLNRALGFTHYQPITKPLPPLY